MESRRASSRRRPPSKRAGFGDGARVPHLLACRSLFGGWRYLLLGSRRRSRFARAAAGAALSMLPQLLLALQIFVQPDRLILDDGVRNLQAPLELLDDVALRAAQDHVDEETLAMFRHAISQPARAPLLGFLDLAAVLDGGMLECSNDLADFFLRRGRTADENQVVQALFHIGLTPFLKLLTFQPIQVR